MTILLYALVAALYLALGAWAWTIALRGHAASGSGAVGAEFTGTEVRSASAIAALAGLPGGGRSDAFGNVIDRHALDHRLESRFDPRFAAPAPVAVMSAGERALLFFVWGAHAWLIREAVIADGSLHFGFAIALSATMWLAIAVVWVESLHYGLGSMRLLVLPLAAVCAVLPLWFPGITSYANGDRTTPYIAMRDWKFESHLLVALAAYGVLTIAALQALLMAALERWLHSHGGSDEGGAEKRLGKQNEAGSAGSGYGTLAVVQDAVLGRLPPLLTLERLLFRLVGAGFVLLSLTVLTGVVFSEAVFGRPMRFDHKTVFTLVSWLIFAALLAGRHLRGWRGRVALRWTLSGFAAMLLAYVGSRFVLEVVLHRF
jgi:ABC-type uncharacterized transport system permease subunit